MPFMYVDKSSLDTRRCLKISHCFLYHLMVYISLFLQQEVIILDLGPENLFVIRKDKSFFNRNTCAHGAVSSRRHGVRAE